MFRLQDIIPKEKLEAFCRRNHIVKLSLVGSVLRDELSRYSRDEVLSKAKVEYAA